MLSASVSSSIKWSSSWVFPGVREERLLQGRGSYPTPRTPAPAVGRQPTGQVFPLSPEPRGEPLCLQREPQGAVFPLVGRWCSQKGQRKHQEVTAGAMGRRASPPGPGDAAQGARERPVVMDRQQMGVASTLKVRSPVNPV